MRDKITLHRKYAKLMLEMLYRGIINTTQQKKYCIGLKYDDEKK